MWWRNVLAASMLAACGPAFAQHAIGVGTALKPGDLAGMVSIPPSGAGLPDGRGTPAQGAVVYAQLCAGCHGEGLQGQKAIGAPALTGGRGTLSRVPTLGPKPGNLPVKTVESYWPYATTLFDYVKRAMPMNAPGSLSDDQVYAVTAFILAQAKIVPGDAVMDARTLPAVQMPNRGGFVWYLK